VSRIRILLIGVSGMLNEIVRAAIASEPDMTIVDSLLRRDEGLGAFTRQHRIDVVIYPASDGGFDGDAILGLLKANPRLSLVALNGERDGGTLHRLAPAHDAIGPLAQSSLAAAIRAGAALRAR
jgi:DNA-binding NarL/FixJ family response regulator